MSNLISFMDQEDRDRVSQVMLFIEAGRLPMADIEQFIHQLLRVSYLDGKRDALNQLQPRIDSLDQELWFFRGTAAMGIDAKAGEGQSQ